MRLGIACTCCLLSGGVLAAEWSFQPALNWRVDHNSNRRLDVDGDSGEGAWLTLSADLKYATDSTALSLQPQATVQRFANESQLDAEEGALRIAGNWLGEYSQLKASAGAEHTSTLTSELDRTGIVDARARRDRRAADAAWERNLTPFWSADAQLSFEDIKYPGGLRFGLIDYRYPSAVLGLTRKMSEHVTLSITAFGGELTAPLTRTQSRNSGGRLGLQWAISRSLQASFSGGLTTTDVASPFGTRRDRGQIWSADLTRTTQSAHWNLSWSRDVAASGRGVLSSHDEVSAGLTHDFSARTSASLGLRGVRNGDVLPGLRDERYNYYAIESGINHRLFQDWSLTLNAGQRQARWATTGQRADGWYTGFALRWTPAPRAVSR